MRSAYLFGLVYGRRYKVFVIDPSLMSTAHHVQCRKLFLMRCKACTITAIERIDHEGNLFLR